MPCRTPCRLFIHEVFTGPLGLHLNVWSELGRSPPFRPMRALRLQWSRAFTLMCEVALNPPPWANFDQWYHHRLPLIIWLWLHIYFLSLILCLDVTHQVYYFFETYLIFLTHLKPHYSINWKCQFNAPMPFMYGKPLKKMVHKDSKSVGIRNQTYIIYL